MNLRDSAVGAAVTPDAEASPRGDGRPPVDPFDAWSTVLLIEDDPGDERLFRAGLARDGLDLDITVVRSLESGLAALAQRGFDVVVLDLGLPDSVGLTGLDAVRAADDGTPIVVLTGHDDAAHVGVEALRRGAQDYLVKGRTAAGELSRSIRYAVTRDRLQRVAVARQLERSALAQLEAIGDRPVSSGEYLQVAARVLATTVDAAGVTLMVTTAHGDLATEVVSVGAGPGTGLPVHTAARGHAAGEGDARGRVSAEVRRGRALTQDEVAFVDAALARVAGVLDRTEAEAVLAVRTRQLHAVHDVAQAIQRGRDAGPDAVIRTVTDILAGAVGQSTTVAAEVVCGEHHHRAGGTAVPEGRRVSAAIRSHGVDVGRVVVVLGHDGTASADERALVDGVADQLATWHALRAADDARLIEVQRLEQLMSTAPAALLLVTDGGVVSVANPAATALLGVAAGDRCPWPIEPGAASPLAEVGSGRSVRGAVDTVVGPDGARCEVSIDATPLLDHRGALQGVVIAVSDVSAQRRRQEALRSALAHERRAAEELRRLDEQKDAFLRAVSHELRTPASVVIGYAETLQQHPERLDASQRRAMTDKIVVHGHRLVELLEDLLDLGRLTSRREPDVHPEPHDLVALVERVVRDVDLGDRRLELGLSPATAHVDPVRTERIVSNLLRNVARHTGPGTTVWVRTGQGPGDVVHVVVEDDGPGVPTELADRVFDVFVQGPAVAHEAKPGTGIGLSLVREFARLQGGEATLEQRPGGGARFVVLLPAAPPDPGPAEG